MTVAVEAVRPRISDYYKPFPKQETFHRSPAKYRLFGGAAGPGKTKALLWEAIYQANEIPGCDTLLLRRTYPELEASLLTQFRRDVPRSLYRTFNESKHVVTWHNGSTTKFGYCRIEKDVYQYQGGEYLFIGLDELTFFTLRQWQFLTSRNRCPVPESFPNMAGASNPGNIGHAWVKSLWIDEEAPGTFERPELYRKSEYAFIRARIEDNPIYANDASYRATLEILPDHLRRAFLEGDWNVFAGQYFDIFDLGRHTIERPEHIGIQPWWPRWISIDWGFHHPSAVYWHTRSGPEASGKVFTYRELVQSGLSPRMLGTAIAERSKQRDGEQEKPEEIETIYLSPDAFAHRTAESSIAEQLGDVLSQNGLPRPTPADDDRIGGWQLMYQLMQSELWAISGTCKRLIDCIPGLVRDEKHMEDIAKADGDDPADSARYGLYSRLRAIGLPLEQRVIKKVADYAESRGTTVEEMEPTARAMMTRRAITIEKKKGKRGFRKPIWRPRTFQ